MKETIYLLCDASGVRKMSKNMPRFKMGQAVVKVLVGIDNKIFLPPPIAEVKLDVEISKAVLDHRTVSVSQES